MAETDALSKFDFSKVTKPSIYLKFKPGMPVVVRILTVDPIVSNITYTNKKMEEITTTQFSWIVYNFTDEKAQVMKTTSNTARKIGELHNDKEFGKNIRKMDLRITPPSEGEIKAYDIQVLRHSGNESVLTNDQIREAQAINLEELSEPGDRMSIFEPEKDLTSGYDKAKATRQAITADDEGQEEVIEDITDEPINLDDIGF